MLEKKEVKGGFVEEMVVVITIQSLLSSRTTSRRWPGVVTKSLVVRPSAVCDFHCLYPSPSWQERKLTHLAQLYHNQNKWSDRSSATDTTVLLSPLIYSKLSYFPFLSKFLHFRNFIKILGVTWFLVTSSNSSKSFQSSDSGTISNISILKQGKFLQD